MTEKEYIEREALMREFAERVKGSNDSDFVPAPTWNSAVSIVECFPAADVEPVRHGPTEDALTMIRAERQRQIDLWGDQSGNHPFEWMSILGEEYGELCEAVNETCFQNAAHPERGGIDKIIKEAVQVAAVAAAIIEVARGAKMDGNIISEDHKERARQTEKEWRALECLGIIKKEMSRILIVPDECKKGSFRPVKNTKKEDCYKMLYLIQEFLRQVN